MKRGAEVRAQRLDGRPGLDLHLVGAVSVVGVEVGPLRPLRGRDPGLDELAVVAEGLAVRQGVVPEEAARGVGQRVVAVVGVAADEAAEVAFEVVGGVGLGRPGVAVGRKHARTIEVVEQDKLLRQGMLVRCDRARKQHQRRVAVALGHVAENLVIGSVFLDDVDDMLDRRRLAMALGHRPRGGIGARRLESGQGERLAVVLGHLAGVSLEPLGGGRQDDRDRAEVVVRVEPVLELGVTRPLPLDIGDDQLLAGRRRQPLLSGPIRRANRDRARIPADGDEAGSPARRGVAWCRRCLRAEIDHGHGVVRAVGDVEPVALERDGHGVWSAAEREPGLGPDCDRLDHRVVAGGDHVDRVAIGAGDVDEPAVRAQRQAAGMEARRDRLDGLARTEVDDRDRPRGRRAGLRVDLHRGLGRGGLGFPLPGRVAPPVRHVGLSSRSDDHAEGRHADGDGLADRLARLGVKPQQAYCRARRAPGESCRRRPVPVRSARGRRQRPGRAT